MTDAMSTPQGGVLHPIVIEIVEAFERDAGQRIGVVRGDGGDWLAIDETASTMTFVEATGDELRITPLVGDADAFVDRPFVRTIRPSWLDGESELVADASALSSYADRGQVMDLMRAALEYWVRSTSTPKAQPLSQADEVATAASELTDVDFTELIPDEDGAGTSAVEALAVAAQLTANVSHQWSWASSVARIPQVSNVTVALAEPVGRARVSVVVSDPDEQFGSRIAFEGALPEGTTILGNFNVPLSARSMSHVEERRGAECLITFEDTETGRLLARHEQAVDLLPRDLWLWHGDPRRPEQQILLDRARELTDLLEGDVDRPDAGALAREREDTYRILESSDLLSKSLLASFVRPNHPEVAVVAREAADRLQAATGDGSFAAFQLEEVAQAEQRADAIVTAIYEALQARSIAYSEPPPGWDYRSGQRIRDHGDVAKSGLGTCMDTTVLTAAVIEQVGLHPVLVLIPGHIFVGYWRRNPLPEKGAKPDWYPGTSVLDEPAAIHSLVEGGWLGVVETTVFTAGKDVSAGDARLIARRENVARGVNERYMRLIDVAAARRAGVSPLPAVHERDDGVTEIVEYRPGGAPPAVIAVEAEPSSSSERYVDSHPARYRTWKSSLFSMNATNALLNLGSSARVQPIALPPEGLGSLEDRLNQDVSFSLHSGWDVSEVWRARDIVNAMQLLESGSTEDCGELLSHLQDRRLYVQRVGRSGGKVAALSHATFVREIRSMAHNAKTAREERGMNPLFLCIGLLRWPYKPGVFAEAPLVLVPVNIAVARGRQDFTLSLDTSQQTTPNAALIEWLRREHDLSVPGLAEPVADRAGIDVDAVLTEVRNAVRERGLALDVAGEARLATLDLSAFRMWQDLNLNADSFFERPLVRHLVHTPTQTFVDPAIPAAEAGGVGANEDELESLETPIPADSTQQRAVLWARQGRSFVLQGPPGTGKSQTITNMVAECLLAGLRVLFVAEKGTALSVVQRRLEEIGVGPFTLNLHHEGSSAAEVRAQLKRALTAAVNPDNIAMENARRHLKNARFELARYPEQLHRPNAAGLSAYAARDELLVLQDGPALPIPTTIVAHHAEQIEALKELFRDLQRWTSSAGVRVGHPWRLAGVGGGDPFDVERVSNAVSAIFAGVAWARAVPVASLREALDAVTHPAQLDTLAMATNPTLPQGDELLRVLDPDWPAQAAEIVAGCERSVAGWAPRLGGFTPDVLGLDLQGIARQLATATGSSFIGRKGRQAAALSPLARLAPVGVNLDPTVAATILTDLIAVQQAGEQVRNVIAATPGLSAMLPANPFAPDALLFARQRVLDLTEATASLRGGDEWSRRVHELAREGHLIGNAEALASYAAAWRSLRDELAIRDADLEAWRNGESLAAAATRVEEIWRREVEHERLVPLQRWCTLVQKLEPLSAVGLENVRTALLEGTLSADSAEDALARGVARASLDERISTEGLDRFDAVVHDQRVTAYAEAQVQIRDQWVTSAPAQIIANRGDGGLGSRTGGLARELEKTTRRLGTRPILRKYGDAVQQLTPLVLASPSSVVDLIEPGVMEFDVVIFDEASQITVPEAIGALGRARAAIVVGDSKQMPPTRKVGGGAADSDIDDPDVEEIVEDQESILSECELARVPTLSLNWHYRSQDEALIAFSNRTYYRGELSSFPTPTLHSSETGLEFRRVRWPENDDKGLYLRAGATSVDLGEGVVAGPNTNPIEATAIAEYVCELTNASPKLPSIGIVTFNEQQRQLIEDLLHASDDPKVADLLDESTMGRGDVLFIKALEQVQGDERDIVIFSIAFSKQANGKVPTNFGPLSNVGGERRLNVAVTRARRKNVVFCSFDPSSNDLDVSTATYQGPKDLKQFLIDAQAAASTRDVGEPLHRVPVRDRHRDEIASALRAAGLHVTADVGMSNFRLDLVLARPQTPDRPLLPVLLDGENWRTRTTVSDRDVLPLEVLRNLMGWPSVARIWWPMWLQNRDEVIASISAEVDRADARLGVGRPA